MEKKSYVKPKLNSEAFVPQSYVAACYDYTAMLYCSAPGSSKVYTNDGTEVGWGFDGLQHGGPCASGSIVEIRGNGTNQGKENLTGYSITNFKLGQAATQTESFTNEYNIGSKAETLIKGNYYRCSWCSSDGANTYYHVGVLKITSEVEEITGRPNHS